MKSSYALLLPLLLVLSLFGPNLLAQQEDKEELKGHPIPSPSVSVIPGMGPPNKLQYFPIEKYSYVRTLASIGTYSKDAMGFGDISDLRTFHMVNIMTKWYKLPEDMGEIIDAVYIGPLEGKPMSGAICIVGKKRVVRYNIASEEIETVYNGYVYQVLRKDNNKVILMTGWDKPEGITLIDESNKKLLYFDEM